MEKSHKIDRKTFVMKAFLSKVAVLLLKTLLNKAILQLLSSKRYKSFNNSYFVGHLKDLMTYRVLFCRHIENGMYKLYISQSNILSYLIDIA